LESVEPAEAGFFLRTGGGGAESPADTHPGTASLLPMPPDSGESGRSEEAVPGSQKLKIQNKKFGIFLLAGPKKSEYPFGEAKAHAEEGATAPGGGGGRGDGDGGEGTEREPPALHPVDRSGRARQECLKDRAFLFLNNFKTTCPNFHFRFHLSPNKRREGGLKFGHLFLPPGPSYRVYIMMDLRRAVKPLRLRPRPPAWFRGRRLLAPGNDGVPPQGLVVHHVQEPQATPGHWG